MFRGASRKSSRSRCASSNFARSIRSTAPSRPPPRPAAACRAAIPSASGSVRSTTTFPIGWRWSTRESCSRRRSSPIKPIRCPRCADASARRIGFAKAPARSTTALAPSASAPSKSTSRTKRSGWAGSPICRTSCARTSAWRSSAPAPQAWRAPMSWCATASRPSSSIAIPRSADCSPSAFRRSSSKKTWWRSAARSWKAWAWNFA